MSGQDGEIQVVLILLPSCQNEQGGQARQPGPISVEPGRAQARESFPRPRCVRGQSGGAAPPISLGLARSEYGGPGSWCSMFVTDPKEWARCGVRGSLGSLGLLFQVSVRASAARQIPRDLPSQGGFNAPHFFGSFYKGCLTGYLFGLHSYPAPRVSLSNIAQKTSCRVVSWDLSRSFRPCKPLASNFPWPVGV